MGIGHGINFEQGWIGQVVQLQHFQFVVKSLADGTGAEGYVSKLVVGNHRVTAFNVRKLADLHGIIRVGNVIDKHTAGGSDEQLIHKRINGFNIPSQVLSCHV